MSKHILIINNGLAGGGIERASVGLANFFSIQGYRISVLALYESEKFFKLNDNIFFLEPNFSRNKLNKYLYLLKMMNFIRKNVKAIQPDTILSFSEWTNPYVVLSLMGLNFPLFLSDRMSPLAKLPTLSELLRKYLYKRATGVIAQSNFAKEILFSKTNSLNIQVIYNPVNIVNKVDCIVRKRIVSVGRLEEVKGHKILIQAFAKLNYLDWDLSIVGDGSLKNELQELSFQLGILDRVIFHGHLSDFSLQLSEAQIFVLPSLKEGFPNALIEAMSLPLACISSDTFLGHNEIIKSGQNGILVQPGNIDELTLAIKELIDDEVLREKIKVNALKVRSDLNFENIAQKYLDIILQDK